MKTWQTYVCGCAGGSKVGIMLADQDGEDIELDLSDDVVYPSEQAVKDAHETLLGICAVLNADRLKGELK